jgi:hypothetical protein
VSKELSLHLQTHALQKAIIAFVSGLELVFMTARTLYTPAFSNGQRSAAGNGLQPYVVLSYGVADYKSRIRVVSLEDVEQLFKTAPWTKEVQQEAPATNGPSGQLDIEHQVLLTNAAQLQATMGKCAAGAVVAYWNLKHCGKHVTFLFIMNG